MFSPEQINKVRRQMFSIIRKYYLGNRTAVNDDTDKLVEDISSLKIKCILILLLKGLSIRNGGIDSGDI
jgi:hypothetical protein